MNYRNIRKENIGVGGFTLVEILIAIVIISIVLSTVYVSYSNTMRIVHDIEYEDQLYKTARTAMDRMIKDLSSLQTSAGDFDFHAEKKMFRNRQFYSLTFWAASHLALGEGEGDGAPAVISYFVQKDEAQEGFSLYRADVPGAKPSPGKNISGGYVICRNIDSFNLKFYDYSDNEVESWDTTSAYEDEQQGKAPVSVKIELALVNANNREAPYKFMTKVFLPVKK
jgi:prepilin-type N-terminal cleavage/methylation domain-containing protein